MRQAALRSNDARQALPKRPDRRRGRTLSPGARGAKHEAPHGPLQRLLGITDVTQKRSLGLHQPTQRLDRHRRSLSPHYLCTVPKRLVNR